MQLVVVMAVRKAVSAATITFTATSIKRCFFITHFSFNSFNSLNSFNSFKKSCPFGQSLYSESSPPALFVNVFEVTSLLTPSLMAIAFTVVVSLRLNASL